jgi:hypothetical protein
MARTIRSRPDRTTVAIVGDGQSERIYFADLRDTDRPKNLSIFPDYPRRIGSFKGVLDRAISLVDTYSRVYALIDMDKVLHDNSQQAYGALKTEVQAAGVIVLENNPCFEIWLLLHFVFTGKLFTNCNEVSAMLQRNDRIPHYNKSERFLVNARLYHSYKHKIVENAIPNAEQLEANRLHQDQLFPRAQTYELFQWYFQAAQ